MKKIIILIALVVVVLIGVAIVVLRPGGNSQSTRPNALVELIGSLTPKIDVRPADLAGQSCWTPDGTTLEATPGQICQTRLPTRANRLRVCVSEGTFAAIRIKGAKYAPQDADQATLACPTGESFSLYDDHSVLSVQCLSTGPGCTLRLS